MNVTIGVVGKFRAFKLAEQLERRGALRKIITSYPRFALSEERVSPQRIVTLPAAEALGRGLARVPGLGRTVPAAYLKSTLFDTLVRRHLDGCDVFVGWAGCSLKSLRAAKARGAVTCIERESSHIAFSEQLLQREHRERRVRYFPTDPRTVLMHLQEYAEADCIIVPSTFAYDSFVREGVDPRKLVKIRSGVDLERFHPLPKTDRTFRAIFVGALSIRKGVHYLLEAASRLRLKNFELLLVGGITEGIRPYLDRYAGAFRYGGTVPNAELHRVYSASSVLVLPSLEEGMAYVIAEAMACGLPAIVSTNTGGADIVREGLDGFVVPICDTQAIEDRLIQLYEDPELREHMADAARQRVQTLTWGRYGAQAMHTYQGLLDRAARDPQGGGEFIESVLH